MSYPASGPHPGPDPEPSASLLHEPPLPTASLRPEELAGTGHDSYRPTASYPTYQPTYQPTYGPGATTSWGAVSRSERNWAVAAHLSGFVAAYVALGFLGPLIVLLTEGSRSPFVRRHAVEALNFNLSVLLWLAISTVLILVLVGIVLLPAIGIMYLVATVLGAMAAGRGEAYRYPLTIRFVR